MDASAADNAARVLDYWRAVELLTPQKLPKEDPSDRDFPVIRLDTFDALPWAHGEARQLLTEARVRRYLLYSGLFPISALRSVLQKQFGKDERSFDRHPGGSACVFAVQLTADGRPLFDTFVLASCPWALSQTLSPGSEDPHWLHGFVPWSETQRRSVEDQWAVSQDDEDGLKLIAMGHRVGRRLDGAAIEEAVRSVGATLQLAPGINPSGHLLKAWWTSPQRALGPSQSGFLNSFFVDDLERVASQLRTGNAGASLSEVLLPDTDIERRGRIDVRGSAETCWEQLAPARFPRGRWPFGSSMAPYFSQQFAINTALGENILGINGPPGTGKTTLLRELVAAVVVKRAQAIAALRRPSDAFEGEATWESDRFTRRISLWKPEFRGFEMVVASNNNRAVENVTLEIPSTSAVDAEWNGVADYFADFATRLQQKTRGAGEAWALIAARFGNKKNRKQFRDSFWFPAEDSQDSEKRADWGFAEYLRTAKAKPSTWKDAVRDFRSALEAEQRLREGQESIWAEAAALKEASARLTAVQARLEKLKSSEAAAAEEERSAAIDIWSSRAEFDEAVSRRNRHHAFKPNLVDALFTLGAAYRRWNLEDERYAERVRFAEAAYDRAAGLLGSIRETHSAATESRSAAEREIADLEATIAKLGVSEMPPWPTAPEPRELSHPWSSEAWNRARTEVFLKALQVHRAFIECSSFTFRRNMWAAMDLLSGKVPSGIDAASAESAWATLFFVIPVISTTFASFAFLFRHLGRESLGWLLIDEAGQTTPQAAIGAIWRSKRVIATGDPLQLDSIVSLPYTSQEALRRHFGVDEIWMPSRNSAQWLIDRASKYGTYVQSLTDDAPLWVGCPLRVHRRCERPMFDIANQIAYAGQMVYDTPALPNIGLSPSRWLHVASECSAGHWIPDEGLLLRALLGDLRASGQAPESVLLITPFRAVALNIRQIGRQFGIRRAGTIHVAQGAEADVVVLVLGSNPASDAAREWASERPNLLNVAVSRAKRRLYIIGNRDLWGTLPHFSEAAQLLTEKSFAALL